MNGNIKQEKDLICPYCGEKVNYEHTVTGNHSFACSNEDCGFGVQSLDSKEIALHYFLDASEEIRKNGTLTAEYLNQLFRGQK